MDIMCRVHRETCALKNIKFGIADYGSTAAPGGLLVVFPCVVSLARVRQLRLAPGAGPGGLGPVMNYVYPAFQLAMDEINANPNFLPGISLGLITAGDSRCCQ